MELLLRTHREEVPTYSARRNEQPTRQRLSDGHTDTQTHTHRAARSCVAVDER